MARGKKKEELSLEEKLEQALVPVEEQPYEVPGNWCWVKFSNIIELISGRDVALTDCNSEGVGIPYILGASSIENNTFIIERWIEVPQVVSCKDDILLSVKGTIGKLYIQQEDKINISRQIMAIRPREILNSKLVYLFFQLVCDELREAGNGLIPGISRTDILDKAFPLMPAPEQCRIVEHVDSLFAKLDEVKEKVQAVIDGFELRKSAILYKAFTGELTGRWRKEHGVGLDSWMVAELKELSSAIGDGLHGTPVYSDLGEYFFINGNNLGGKMILIKSDTKKINRSEYERYKVELNESTVFVSINGTLGKTSFYNNEPVVLGKSACYINVNERLNKYFLRFFLCSKAFIDYANENATGSTIKNLGLKAIRSLSIHLPSIEEQAEIVCILDGIFNKEQQVQKVAEVVLDQIDIMKKAILARAFRGELGTNDPAEDSVVDMLKKIL